MSGLEELLQSKVLVATTDGRIFVGTLRGFDQMCNIILEHTVEREFNAQRGVVIVALGLYIIKGENIAVVGSVDPEIDESMDLSQIMCDPLPKIAV
ncbi:hypothetical protein CAOG_05070 [Capsaspora owczarzaki ATCC 30864]|uniref:U6 snRNA-associated Sm-like protein LSm8 n=1 Tax=Capsaspora owczarzaki (strain ATCC 30864) TaxID=595528 RepID=A0A0D2VT70_CAPO3|nr:hypothetical protein CAOG_05070 [Capsaspora owczarzaki ATCC 30864]KJE94427.1 hypothetical protein CAOG_005070 [Capsaspora owczarzaki ATCC 30864]|eukprot:XP_004346755.1 hypothetical protein CAOG_05070 [Capsaspora owczarzaki ATCC 30864]